MLLLVLVACSDPPAACDTMCAAAALTYGDCLDQQGLDWEAAGYADADAFVGSCETWAWEQLQLGRDAGLGRSALAASCAERQATIEQAECEEFMALDWNGRIEEETP